MLQSMGMQRVRHYSATEQQEPTIPGPFQGLIRDDPSSPRQHLGSTFYKIAVSPFLTIVKKNEYILHL